MNTIEKSLYDAILYGTNEQVTALVERNPELRNARLCGNYTPLIWAAILNRHGWRGKGELVDDFINAGASIDLAAATILGRTAAAADFLERRPDVIHKRSPCGYSLLHLAAMYGDPEMVGMLLARGMDPNEARNDPRYTPLFCAYPHPYEKAELLLAHGADIMARAKHGSTVLHHAVALGDQGWVDFLLRHGADPEAQTKARQSPWSLAVKYRKHAIAARLVKASLERGQEHDDPA